MRRRRHYNIELNITYGCNRACRYCNRLLDVQPIRDADMTVEQVEQFVGYVRDNNLRFRLVKLAGGEPTVHPQFRAIARAISGLRRTRHCRAVVVMTNGTRPRALQRLRISYNISSPHEKQHERFLISPYDVRITGHYGTQRPCPITRRCGISLDAFGWTPCPVASVVGRLAGVNPYSFEPVCSGRADVCRHCIYSVPSSIRQCLRSLCEEGRLEYPTPTLAAGLVRLNVDPPQFVRWFPIYAENHESA